MQPDCANYTAIEPRPPYGGEKLIANTHVFAGPEAWDRANQRRKTCGPGSALVLPDGEDPNGYRWPMIGTRPTVIWPGARLQQKIQLARCLVLGGSSLVCVVQEPLPDYDAMFFGGEAL